MARWLLGLLIIAVVGSLWGFLTAGPRIEAMEGDIRSALNDAGHSWASVEMSGNVATLSGEAPTPGAAADAALVAENTRCSACSKKHKWHTVRSNITTRAAEAVPAQRAIPVQAPYTFSARKTEDGRVVLDGYVPDEETRARILRDAEEIMIGSTIVDDRVRVASGAPDGRWAEVIDEHFRELAAMTSGRFEMEDFGGAITGVAPDADVQARILEMVENDTPSGYSIASNIRVPGAASRQSGEVRSQAICQNLLNDLREGKRVFFEQGEAVIRGDQNFDLLNEMAAAANQCPSFRVSVNGYTSSEGPEALNQQLSERRANAVLAYLTREGQVERTRIDATGYGEADPIADNSTAAGRERNRRIEFILSRSE